MRQLERLLVVGLLAQVGLVAALARVTHVDLGGWAVALTYTLLVVTLLRRALRQSDTKNLGPANGVTLTRSILVGGVSALVVSGPAAPHTLPALVILAAVALALDAVDGRVARRTGGVSTVGARFDGEVDAFLILVLSVAAIPRVGVWVLLIGAMRYAFWAAGLLLPWLRGSLPPRYWRKVVAAIQGVTLTLAVSGLLPRLATVLVAAALLLLVESFEHDVDWLWSARVAHRAGRPRSRVRRVAGSVGTGLAVVTVWAALVAPDDARHLTPAAFGRVPLEGLVVLALALVLPPRWRRVTAVLSGSVLAALMLLRALDLGFHDVLQRPFDPLADGPNLVAAFGVLADDVGPTVARLLAAGVGLVVLLGVLGIVGATVAVTRLAVRHRRGTAVVVAVLATLWTVSATFHVTNGAAFALASAGSASSVTARIERLQTETRDSDAFAHVLHGVDRLASLPADQLLSGLRGKDVLVVVVESYGRVAVEGSTFAPQVDALLRDQTKQLAASGFYARSAFLTSPTFGGVSWLAHSTLQSGLWVDSPQRYDELLSSRRSTLFTAFRRAGWRTVDDIPSSPSPWPPGQRFYGFDALYGRYDTGYRGPAFSYAKIPDQYTLAALYQRELAPQPRRPVMAEVDLVSSHQPWAPLPRMVPWSQLGDGSVFAGMPAQGQDPKVVWRSPAAVQAAYAQSIEYSLTALTSFLTTYGDDNLVVLMYGDHQPLTTVSGEHASHDVPVSILAKDPSVLRLVAGWHWQPGLLPHDDAPVWRMDRFRDRFLTAFSGSGAGG